MICTLCLKCAEACPSTALQVFGKEWTVKELYKEIDKDRTFYETSGGGVTISGGEPMMQVDFILELLKKCKTNNINTALDTCGYSSKTNYEKLFPFVDLFLYDLKEINSEKHKEYTGVPNETILANCKWLVEQIKGTEKEIWIRTPIIPSYTATKENVQGIAKFIVNELKNNIHRWDLLAFNNLAADKYERMDWEWKLEDVPLLELEVMEYYYELAVNEGVKNVHWSGMTQKNM